jgi:hypothetical protein
MKGAGVFGGATLSAFYVGGGEGPWTALIVVTAP